MFGGLNLLSHWKLRFWIYFQLCDLVTFWNWTFIVASTVSRKQSFSFLPDFMLDFLWGTLMAQPARKLDFNHKGFIERLSSQHQCDLAPSLLFLGSYEDNLTCIIIFVLFEVHLHQPWFSADSRLSSGVSPWPGGRFYNALSHECIPTGSHQVGSDSLLKIMPFIKRTRTAKYRTR